MKKRYNIKFRDISEAIIIIYILVVFRSYLSYEQVTSFIISRGFKVNSESVLQYLSLYKSSRLEYRNANEYYKRHDSQLVGIDVINTNLEYNFHFNYSSKFDVSSYIVIFINITIFSIIYTIYNRSRKRAVII